MIAFCNFNTCKTRIFTRLYIYSRLQGNMFKQNLCLLDEMYLKTSIESTFLVIIFVYVFKA